MLSNGCFCRLQSIILATAMCGLIGCGGTKIKDYDEGVPIPDIPVAGGAGETEEPIDDATDAAADSPAESPASPAADQAKTKPRRTREEPSAPVEAVEID